MPTWRPRVSIPSTGGLFECILDKKAFGIQFPDRRNRANALLLSVSWISLIADSPVDSVKPNRVISRFHNEISKDLIGLIKSYSALADRLSVSLSNSTSGIVINDYLFDEFKRTPIFREYYQFVQTQSTSLLQYILTFLLFGKKFLYIDANLDSIALRKWIEVEDRIRNVQAPPYSSWLRQIIASAFVDWRGDCFLPVHGSGAVAERGIKGRSLKNLVTKHTPLTSYLYRSSSIFLVNESNAEYIPYGTNEVSEPAAARLKFVPKDIKTTRSICMEPAVNQWAQQGVRAWYEHALMSGWMGEHVPLHDQTINAEAAQYGSLTSRIDTIDLSAASDSVSWELVKSIFPSKILKHLHATRSKRVELPSGEIIEVSKFAPMGSALCFPVQSTIYLAIVTLVGIAWRFGQDVSSISGKAPNVEVINSLIRMSFADTLGEGNQNRLEPTYVYGDDIICDTRITSNVIRTLESLGFAVNVSKSFTGDSAFRESCGGYYAAGKTVTPLRYKVKEFAERISITSLASVIDLANRAYKMRYMHLRRHLIQFVLRYPIYGVRASINPILFSDRDDEAYAILSSDLRNTHLLTREKVISTDRNEQLTVHPKGSDYLISHDDTNYLYQRDELKSITAGPRDHRNLLSFDEDYLYTAWWRSRLGMTSSVPQIEASHTKADALRQGVTWRWTPR